MKISRAEYNTSSSLIKEFVLDGKKFRILNVVSFEKYTHFVVELWINGGWNKEYETSVGGYPEMSWQDVMNFIKTRAGAEKRLENFLKTLE